MAIAGCVGAIIEPGSHYRSLLSGKHLDTPKVLRITGVLYLDLLDIALNSTVATRTNAGEGIPGRIPPHRTRAYRTPSVLKDPSRVGIMRFILIKRTLEVVFPVCELVAEVRHRHLYPSGQQNWCFERAIARSNSTITLALISPVKQNQRPLSVWF